MKYLVLTFLITLIGVGLYLSRPLTDLPSEHVSNKNWETVLMLDDTLMVMRASLLCMW